MRQAVNHNRRQESKGSDMFRVIFVSVFGPLMTFLWDFDFDGTSGHLTVIMSNIQVIKWVTKRSKARSEHLHYTSRVKLFFWVNFG